VHETPIDDVADVLVIGGGMAGITALLSATELGARGVLLERTDGLGGSTVLSGGMLAFAGTDEQAAAGIDDNVEGLRKDLLETGRNRNSVALVDTYCDQQLPTYRWLRDHGIEFGKPMPGSGQSVPRGHTIDTAAAIESLARLSRAKGAEIRLRVRVMRLIVEEARVVGVQALIDDQLVDIRSATVIITSGGFTRNEELLRRFAPGMEHALRAGGAGNTGDGLLMACKVGAAVLDTPHIKGTFGSFPWPSRNDSDVRLLPIYKGGIAVNGYGERFINESLPYKEIGDACLAQPEGIAYQIFDATVLATAEPSVNVYNFDRRVEGGQVRQSETLEGLAEELGLPADVLERTVADYNGRIDAGEADPLGRRTLSGGVGQPMPLVAPPFYGFPSATALLGTYCGVAVDAQARVLDVFDEPIPGLYAAGEVTGGFHGGGYVSGSSIGKAAIFGRISGQSAALEARDATH
jgi:fumarate reductase flavoprotein subunit